jgi:hypothetical protein
MQNMKSPAHLILMLWAGAWAPFLISEAFAWRTVIGNTVLWMALGVLFVLLALVPLRWEPQGGALLMVCGLSLLLAYRLWPPTQLRPATQALLALLLALPPLFTGLLFFSRRARPIELRIRSTRG